MSDGVFFIPRRLGIDLHIVRHVVVLQGGFFRSLPFDRDVAEVIDGQSFLLVLHFYIVYFLLQALNLLFLGG